MAELTEMTGWEGQKVLYFGDHPYADLADLSLNFGWRTGALIQESVWDQSVFLKDFNDPKLTEIHFTGTASLNAKLQLSLKILGLNFEMHKKFNEHFKLNFLCIWLYWKIGISIKVQMQMQFFSLVHRTTQNLPNASKRQMQMQNLMTYEPGPVLLYLR